MNPANSSIEQTLQNIVSRKLEISPDKVQLDQSLLEDMGLDSFNIMSILVEIEETFPPVSLSHQSFDNLRTLRDVADYIRQELAKP